MLKEVDAWRGAPARLQVDNGLEFHAATFIERAEQNGVELDFIRPGKPTENGYIESFNGRRRDECLIAINSYG